MDRGHKSFLTTRSADEAMPVLLRLFREENWVKKQVAARLDVDYTTLWRWLTAHPKQAKEIAEKQKRYLELEAG